MISVLKAQSLIYEAVQSIVPKFEVVPLRRAFGQIIAEDIVADRDQPPFDRVAMDGIAISSRAFQEGVRRFRIEGMQKAGEPAMTLSSPDACLEIMTGAMLPDLAGAVIPYEDLTIDNGYANVKLSVHLKSMANIHQQGSDKKKGETLLTVGTLLNSPQIAVAAAVGKHLVTVYRSPRISIVSTGDELVNIDEEPASYQIRGSNSYAIQAALEQLNVSHIQCFHAADHEKSIYEILEQALRSSDICLISGGISAGKFDFVPRVLQKLSVDKIFHKVAQRPGKPLWFGCSRNGTLVFGLPGNPVASLMSLYRFVIPFISEKFFGRIESKAYAKLEQDIPFKNHQSMTLFAPIKLNCDPAGFWLASSVASNGSGDLVSLADSDGFIELAAGSGPFHAGQVFPVYLWQHLSFIQSGLWRA